MDCRVWLDPARGAWNSGREHKQTALDLISTIAALFIDVLAWRCAESPAQKKPNQKTPSEAQFCRSRQKPRVTQRWRWHDCRICASKSQHRFGFSRLPLLFLCSGGKLRSDVHSSGGNGSFQHSPTAWQYDLGASRQLKASWLGYSIPVANLKKFGKLESLKASQLSDHCPFHGCNRDVAVASSVPVVVVIQMI